MKRLIIFIAVIIFITPQVNSQFWKLKRYEVIGFLGPSQFFGDVGGYSLGSNAVGLKDISIRQTRFSTGAFLRYTIREDMKVKGGISYIMLHANDVRGSNENRGFEMVTSVVEPSVLYEYYFLKNRAQNSYLFMRGRSNNLSFFWDQIDVYGTAGLGAGFYFVKPNDILKGRMQKDKGFTATIPVGAGASLVLTPSMSAGIELLAHVTFTDYLDGYTSQYSARNDLFYTLNFTYCYKFSLFNKRRPNGVRY